MLTVRRIASMVLLMHLALSATSQDLKKWEINGYLKSMQTVWVDTGNNWLTDNLLHNRINFHLYPTDNITAELGVRNRLLFGELVKMIPAYNEILDEDHGWADMSWVLAHNDAFVLHSHIDRAFIDLTKDSWQFTLGRQRINWGMNLVWNPNDLFNNFSFFDFDYEERPGSDAVRIQRYLGPASSAELVWTGADSVEAMGFAGRYLLNFKGYDVQLIGGYVKQDRIIGLGWAGNIKGAGFRGEATAFFPEESSADTAETYVASISVDYTFSGSLYLHGGALYNSRGKTGKAGGVNQLLNTQLTAKMLSPARWALFAQASRQLSPLVNASAAAIINPLDGSMFIGPTLTVSLGDELDLMFSSQAFFGEDGSEFGDYGSLWYLRFKWSF